MFDFSLFFWRCSSSSSSNIEIYGYKHRPINFVEEYATFEDYMHDKYCLNRKYVPIIYTFMYVIMMVSFFLLIFCFLYYFFSSNDYIYFRLFFLSFFISSFEVNVIMMSCENNNDQKTKKKRKAYSLSKHQLHQHLKRSKTICIKMILCLND